MGQQLLPLREQRPARPRAFKGQSALRGLFHPRPLLLKMPQPPKMPPRPAGKCSKVSA